MSLKVLCTGAEDKSYTLGLDVSLHDIGSLVVENRGKYPVCKVDNSHLGTVMFKSLGSLQTDKTCAHDEHL